MQKKTGSVLKNGNTELTAHDHPDGRSQSHLPEIDCYYYSQVLSTSGISRSLSLSTNNSKRRMRIGTREGLLQSCVREWELNPS